MPRTLLTTLLLSCIFLSSCTHVGDDSTPHIQHGHSWKMGAKIHFEKESGATYIGLKDIHLITKNVLKRALNITQDTCEEGAKILLQKGACGGEIHHYAEKKSPHKGEEMHATLLYTKPQGFYPSETLAQVCPALFSTCEDPPPIQNVSQKYTSIIPSHQLFQIEKIVITRHKSGPSFIMAKLLCNGQSRLHLEGKPISAGLHLTLVNCADPSLISSESVANQLIHTLNQELQGKHIKVATSTDSTVDLEFGLSGQSFRLRGGKIMSQ